MIRNYNTVLIYMQVHNKYTKKKHAHRINKEKGKRKNVLIILTVDCLFRLTTDLIIDKLYLYPYS